MRTQTENAERSWLSSLPMIMMGIRNSINEDSNLSPAQAAFGTNMRMPGDIILPSIKNGSTYMKLSPWPPKTHGTAPFFIPKDLASCKQVWVKCETSRPPKKRLLAGKPRLYKARRTNLAKL